MNGDLSYEDSEEYLVVLAHFQKGDWQEGMELLNYLIQKYPLETNLRSLRQEMALRAKVDDYEIQETKHNRFSRFRSFLVKFLVVLVVGGGLLYLASNYASWIRSRVDSAKTKLAEEMRTYDLEAKYNSAQQYLASYRVTEARDLLQQIQAEEPEYPGLTDLFATADQIEMLNNSYDQAMTLKGQGDLKGALDILTQMTTYRDVSLQIREIETSFNLNTLLGQGDQAVMEGNWAEAIRIYEDVRNRDSLFMRQEVENRLYNGYINAARALLEESPDSLEALQQARDYYAKALTIRPQDVKVEEELTLARQSVVERLFNGYLEMAEAALVEKPDSISALKAAEQYFNQALQVRPNDPTVVLQRNAAQAFTQAKESFDDGQWDNVIRLLGSIYERDPDYAKGTARQMLYDAFILRGDDFILTGRAQSALQDYTYAIAIAEMRPDSALRLFESKARLGDVLGLIGNYETAVYQYRVALDEAGILESGLLSTELSNSLKSAENYTLRGRYKNAWNIYKEAIDEIVDNFQTVTVVVASEDYLSQLANEYQTTVNAILLANKASDPANISIGDKIVIPVIP